jgi:cytidylate kinase
MAILTISREYGSGGEEIGHQVADRLSYEYVDKERLLTDLEKVGSRWARIGRELDEVNPSLFERYDWQYQGFVAQMDALMLAYAAADRVVIIGRGGSFLLQTVPYCLRVRLVAPLMVRVDRIMMKESLDQEAAEALIARVDRDRAGYVKANFGKDWHMDMLLPGLADKDRLITPEGRTHLQHLALAYRLKARLATEPRLRVPTLEVTLEDSTLAVSCVIHSPGEESLLKEISREVCGDLPVRFNLHRRV